MVGNVLQVQLNDEILQQLNSAGVRIAVPAGARFDRVILNYPASTSTESEVPPMPAESNLDNTNAINSSNSTAMSNSADSYYQHFVKLTGADGIQGQMDLSDTIQFTTKFGEVDISVAQIAGIRFHIDGEDAAVVVLKNGDSLTGVPSAEMINLNTDWGRAELDPVFVEEITTSSRARFQQSNDPAFGARWQLINR